MLLQIWSKMSCSGILPDFSICSGIEELIYLLRGAPRGRPGRGAARGRSRLPAGVLRRHILGGAPPAGLRRRTRAAQSYHRGWTG